ncbi:hypothetical protein C491_04500 [Natronococcus amylolyticus DSM 10524]|uniref:Uncharacterized protein n=1 Tax=Natronococcus amylolyticus DSM 10524 TaxID=1227497 RepID=L9XIP8_9EURY|nr:hypothetical protein C491_04500 [Natronococcus amylolyticus DSM 10524]
MDIQPSLESLSIAAVRLSVDDESRVIETGPDGSVPDRSRRERGSVRSPVAPLPVTVARRPG